MGAAVLAIADIERQLERLITQRKAEREAVAGHTVAENGKDQKAKPGGGGHDERTDGSSIGSKATQNKRYNLNEELLAGVLGIPLITNEIARGGRSRPESPPTTSAPSLIPISIPMPTPTSTPSTTQRPTTPTNAVECVLQGASSNDNAVTAASIQEPASPLNNSSMTAAATASFEPSQSVVAAALRREIMGEVKAELLMEVSRRDKENQGKLYDLELENRELKQELHGLLREMREDRRRKERERAERKKRGQRRSQQKRDSNSGSSDVESSDDEMRSDPEADEEEEPRRKGLKRRRRSDIGVPNSKRKREDDATPATLGGKEAVAAEEDQRGAQPETTAEQAEPVLPHEKKPSTEQLAGVPQVSPHGVDRSLSTSDSDEAIAPTRGGRRKPSRSTVWRRKKGRRAAEEIEHDNEERYQPHCVGMCNHH
jgi:Skp family chaperone for outer membrane proteins